MKTPLAWKNLIHDRLRTAVALAGVAFAVLLVFMQLGFWGSVLSTATIIYDRLNFDLMLRSPEYLHLSRAGVIPKIRLTQAESVRGVAAVNPFYIAYLPWRNPQTDQRRAILVMAFDPRETICDLSEVNAQANQLAQVDNVIIDRRTRPEFGPRQPGQTTDVGRERLRIAGQFTMGTGFGADGAIMMSDQTLARVLPDRDLDDISLGLVRIAADADPLLVQQRLRAVLPDDVDILTRAQVASLEQQHWVSRTSVGVIFATGVGVALVVGMAIVYQVLASNIANHMGEYATLKAMGYTGGYLSNMVLQQAWILAVFGFIPGFLLALGLYALTRHMAHIPIGMTTLRATLVFVSCVVMCSLAGLGSLRKVHTADPAELF